MSPEKLPVEKNIMGNTEKKIKVLVKPQCDAEIRDRFITKFGEKCEFVFEENETRDSITTAEVVIGEPEESEIQKAGNFRWVQLTWAGADKYTKTKTFPTGATLTNASGAFGKIICDREHHCPVPRISCLLEKREGTSLGTE